MTSLHPGPDSQLTRYHGRWTLDPALSSFTFRTKAMWVLPVKGTITASSGTASVGEDGTVRGDLVLDATSLVTGTKKRDAHLQTAEFFDTARYPTIDFQLDAARMISPTRAAINGTLAIHGERKPVSLEADIEAGATTATLSGEIEDLDRREYAISWTKMGAGVHNKITFRAVFTKA